jgi:ornithine cyclodeaminase/alanine dehydrogenase-like protein (mu-crystallin family)
VTEALWVRAEEAAARCSLDVAVDALTRAYTEEARNQAAAVPRNRLTLPLGVFHVLVAHTAGHGFVGLKASVAGPPDSTPLTLLWSADSGQLLAVVESGPLGPLRTAATSVLAAQWLAGERRRLTLIGAGRQAAHHGRAFCSALPVERVAVWSRDASHAERLAALLSDEHGVAAERAASLASATADADLVVTATRAETPLVEGRLLPPGAHVTAIGADHPTKRELDGLAVSRAEMVVVDSLAQARRDAGDLIAAADERLLEWSRVAELGQVLAQGAPPERSADAITLLSAQGSALGDIALAARVYELVRADAGTAP